jgi:hypothetical protein
VCVCVCVHAHVCVVWSLCDDLACKTDTVWLCVYLCGVVGWGGVSAFHAGVSTSQSKGMGMGTVWWYGSDGLQTLKHNTPGNAGACTVDIHVYPIPSESCCMYVLGERPLARGTYRLGGLGCVH